MVITVLGTGHATKSNEFSEKFQRVGESFSIKKIILQILDPYKWLFSDILSLSLHKTIVTEDYLTSLPIDTSCKSRWQR